MKTTYKVTARKWRLGWELDIEGVGVTQSYGLADAEAMVRDYVADEFGVAEDSFDVEIAPEVGDGLDAEVAATRAKLREVELARTRAAEQSRLVVRRLKDKGLSGKDIAAVVGISPQRVSQLLGGGKKRAAV